MKRFEIALVGFVFLSIAGPALAHSAKKLEYSQDFLLEACDFSNTGRNPWFSLEPDDLLILEGEDDGEFVELHVTVLPDTHPVDFVTAHAADLSVETRVVEEREWSDGTLVEVSRNYFARCEQTGDVYYFGEDVDIFLDDGSIVHDGAWIAGADDALPGIIMPGSFLLGARYYQEIAPDVALDRAEHVAEGLLVEVPAGQFERCVEVIENSPLEKKSESTKIYCPGIGLVYDDGVELVGYELGGE